MRLDILPGLYRVYQYAPGTGFPDWLPDGDLVSVSRSREEVSIVCAISTFNTDYLLVKEVDLVRAVTVLAEAGHQVTG